MKKILSVVIAFVLLFSAVPLCELNVSAATSGYYTYTVSNGKATITKCDETISGNVTIPSTLGGYSVTKIGTYAFNSCISLKSITIPDSVTNIGNYAFPDCTSLASVTIPDSVTNIGDYAFCGCSSLTSITIPNNVTSIGKGTFYRCNSLKKITVPFVGNTLNGKSNTHFGYIFGANSYSDNKSYVPSSLNEVVITKAKNIDSYAFYTCKSLTSITIPNSVTSIGEFAFDGCESLTKVNITDLAAWCNIYFNSNESNPLSYAKSLYINDKLATNITIPNGVTSIGGFAFSGCESLTSVTIPNSVRSIGEFAFHGCKSLTSVVIGDSVASIGCQAFSPYLKKIYIFSKNCVLDSLCGMQYNHIIYGYVGSTAQTLANEVGAEFIDITTIHVHNYNSATCTSPQTCKSCGFTTGESLGHTGGTATCKAKAKCTRCEEYYGSLNANNHVNVRSVKPVTSTCTKTGLTEGKKCADCDKVIVAQQTVAKKDHSYSNNCDKSCNVCGATRTVGEHIYSNACDTTCNKCGHTRTTQHVYENESDMICNVCGYDRSIPTKITSSKHTITGNSISKITAGTTVSSLLSGLNEGSYCKIYKGSSQVIGTTAICTGMVVKIMDGNTVKASYTVIVTGDTNGDGATTITDMIAIKAHILNKSTLTGVYAIAANTNGDSGISITDFIQVKAKILGKGSITAR